MTLLEARTLARQWTCALLLAALLAGCGEVAGQPDEGHPAGVATPTSFEQCNHGPSPHGDGAAYSLASHWTGGRHAFGEDADLFVCVNPTHGGQVSVTAPDGVEVRPARQRVDRRGDGILAFVVRVQRGASGVLEISTRSRDGGATTSGPGIDAGGDRWLFVEPG
jgi:hypothetical protein